LEGRHNSFGKGLKRNVAREGGPEDASHDPCKGNPDDLLADLRTPSSHSASPGFLPFVTWGTVINALKHGYISASHR
jgi:hypothetical protein